MASEKLTYRYFKGQLRAQFSLGDEEKCDTRFASKPSFQMFPIRLEPKFQLYEAQEIEEVEFLEQGGCLKSADDCKCQLHARSQTQLVEWSGNEWVEVFPGTKTENGSLLLLDQAKAYCSMDRWIAEPGTFYSKDLKAGKLNAEAFVRVVKDREEIQKIVLRRPDLLPRGGFNFQPESARSGCFGGTSSGLFGRLFGGAGAGGGGCFGPARSLFGGLGLPGTGTPGGCFGAASQPGGCFSLGWLGRILSLLGLLGLLLYLLSSLQNCSRAEGNQVVYIHDTVVVEVVKERVDTLEVVRIDTAKFVKTNNVQTTDMVALPNVQFETDKDILVPGSLPDIQQLAEYLIKNKHINALIMGHTDNKGDSLHNFDLSQRRAQAVKDFLVKLGVEGNRVKAKGFGSTKPKASNETLEGRLMNRRVEVQLSNTVLKSEETVRIK